MRSPNAAATVSNTSVTDGNGALPTRWTLRPVIVLLSPPHPLRAAFPSLKQAVFGEIQPVRLGAKRHPALGGLVVAAPAAQHGRHNEGERREKNIDPRRPS